MMRLWTAAMFAFTLTCLAQDAETAKYYKLDFVVKEVDGTKVLNTRAYSMTVSTDKTNPPSSMRTGSKVPVPTSADGKQLQFVEIGVNIDCRSIKDVGNELGLILSAEVSSTLQETASPSYPVIRQNKWTSAILVPLQKPTVVFSSDDSTTKHKMQLELTAIPLK